MFKKTWHFSRESQFPDTFFQGNYSVLAVEYWLLPCLLSEFTPALESLHLESLHEFRRMIMRIAIG